MKSYYVYLLEERLVPATGPARASTRNTVTITRCRDGVWTTIKYKPEEAAHAEQVVSGWRWVAQIDTPNSGALRKEIEKRWPDRRWKAYYKKYVADRTIGELRLPPASWVGHADWADIAVKHYEEREGMVLERRHEHR